MSVKVPLMMACPIGRCPRDQMHSWVHSPDSGEVFIDRRAHITCAKCTADSFVLEWRWRCNHESHGGQYEKATVANLAAVLSDAQRYEKIEGGAFFLEMMRNLVLGTTC